MGIISEGNMGGWVCSQFPVRTPQSLLRSSAPPPGIKKVSAKWRYFLINKTCTVQFTIGAGVPDVFMSSNQTNETPVLKAHDQRQCNESYLSSAIAVVFEDVR